MTHAEFVGLKKGAILIARKSGKTYRVVVAEPSPLETSGFYVYAQRHGENLTKRESACGSPIRAASAAWIVTGTFSA